MLFMISLLSCNCLKPRTDDNLSEFAPCTEVLNSLSYMGHKNKICVGDFDFLTLCLF